MFFFSVLSLSLYKCTLRHRYIFIKILITPIKKKRYISVEFYFQIYQEILEVHGSKLFNILPESNNLWERKTFNRKFPKRRNSAPLAKNSGAHILTIYNHKYLQPYIWRGVGGVQMRVLEIWNEMGVQKCFAPLIKEVGKPPPSWALIRGRAGAQALFLEKVFLVRYFATLTLYWDR